MADAAVLTAQGQGRVPVRRRAQLARPSALGRAGLMPWVPVWMALGIGLWLVLPFHPGLRHYLALWTGVAGLGAGLGLMIRHAGGRVSWQMAEAARLTLLAVLVAAIGFTLIGLRSERVAAPVLGFRYYGPIEGRLVEIDRSGRDRLRITLDQPVLERMEPARTPRRLRLSLLLPDGETPDIPPIGTRIMLTGHLGPPPPPAEPGGFDFRRHAWFESLGAIGYSRSPIMVSAPAADGIGPAIGRWRMRLSVAIQTAIPGQAGAVASAVTTGDRSGIETATNEIMRDSNLYHIVSISGLHMSLLAGFLYAVLRQGLVAMQAAGLGPGLAAHKLAAALALVGAAGYLALSGGGPATERAFVMVAVMLTAILFDRRAISLRTVALAAVILLGYAPEALVGAGFQMSFAATVALIAVNDHTKGMGRDLPRWLKPVLFTALTSIIAGLATGPIAAAQFNRISHYGLLANIAAVPVMGMLVMPAAVLAAVLGPLGLAGPALWVMGVGTEWMLLVAGWTAGLSGAVSTAPTPHPVVLPMLGLGGVLLVLTPWERLRDGRLAAPTMVLPRRVRLSGWLRSLPWQARLGALILLVALAVWLRAPRPALLIAPEGEAVGLMTPAGRVPSKPAGGSFVVSSWLVSDGDHADQPQAAERPAWDGPRNAREAKLPWGGHILHVTGKDAELRGEAACRPGLIVVLDRAATAATNGGCMVIDLSSLRRSGAIAFDRSGQMVSAAQTFGQRPWTGR